MNKRFSIFIILILGFLLVSCSPENRIIGKWYDEYGTEVDFYKDGTFVLTTFEIPITGNYRFVDKETLIIDSEGIIGLFGAQVFTVQVSNNELTLEANNSTILMYREKPTTGDEFLNENQSNDAPSDTEDFVNNYTETTEEEQVWFDDINPILIYYQDTLSIDDSKKYENVYEPISGMRKIAFQIAFQNLSSNEWIRINPRFLSVSGDGLEFERRDFAQPCQSAYDEENPEKTAFCSSMYNGYISTELIPPMFQVTTSVIIWEVGEQSQNLVVNVAIRNSEGESHTYEILLDQSNIEEFGTQFVGNISWEEYKNLPLENIQISEFGETNEYDFGTFTPLEYFKDDDYDPDWLLRSEITNSSAGYPMYFDISNGFFIDAQNYSYQFGGHSEKIGPKQSALITSYFGNDNNYIGQILEHKYHTPQSLAELKNPLCWVITEFEWRTTEGNNSADVNLIFCSD